MNASNRHNESSRRQRRHRELALAIFLALCATPSANAQQTQTNGSSDDNGQSQSAAKAKDAVKLKEVMVTARKTKEPASKTPVALTVVSGDDLKATGVTSVVQLADVSPGVTIGRDPFGVNVNIRGVTTTDQTSKGEQGIAFNVDGFPIERPFVQGLSFFDIDSVEILRGPQGTLYGSSTTGGAINVTTNKPQNELDASADVEFGNYNTRRENAMINIPVNSILALRFAVNANDRDGFIHLNDGGTPRDDEHDRAARGSALFTFSPNTTLLLTLTGDHVGGVGYSTVPVVNVLDNSSGAAQRAGFTNPFSGHLDDYNRAFNGEFNTVFGGVHMTYLAGVADYSAHERTSSTFDPADNPVTEEGADYGDPQYAWRNYLGDFRTLSNELRFANAEPGPLTWVAGLNYIYEDIHESDHNLNALVSDPTIEDSVNAIDPVNHTTHRSAGVFGQATYNITDQWRVTGGVRYTKDDLLRTGTFAAGPEAGCSDALLSCLNGAADNASERDHKVTYRIGTDYLITPEQMIYASISTGYKPGGFNDFDYTTHGIGTYLPEQLTAYELGYKGRLTDSLQFNSDFFYYDYARDQISSLTLVNGSPIIFTKTVPATIYGWENDITYKVTPEDLFKASASFERSKYGDFLTGIAQDVNWTGYSLDKTPHAVLTLSYTHEWSLQSGAYLSAYLGTKYSTSYFVSDFVNAIQYRQRAYTRTDATLTYTAASDHYYVQFFVKNLENKVQILSIGSNYDAGISEPRYVGVRLGIRMH